MAGQDALKGRRLPQTAALHGAEDSTASHPGWRSPPTKRSKRAGGELVADTFGIGAGFCHPHSQRGQIENQNRQIRWSYPRGADLSLIAPDHADGVAAILNSQRRPRLQAVTGIR